MKSIRSIVFLSIFWVISTFFLVLTGVSYFLIQNIIPQFVIEDSSTSLSYVVENIRENYYGQLNGLETVSHAPVFTNFDKKESQNLIRNFLHFGTTFQTVHLYRATGELLFAERRADFPDYKAENNFYLRKDRDFVELAENVIKSRKPEASQVLYTTNRFAPYQVYVVPVFEKNKEGQVWALLSGAVFLPLPRFDALINGLALSRKNFLLVSDRKGRQIMSHGLDNPEDTFLKRHLEQISARLDSSSDSHQVYVNAEQSKPSLVEKHGVEFGFPYYLISQKFREADLVVTLGVNIEAVEARKTQLIQYLLAGYTLCLIILLGLSVVISRRLSRPLDEISQTIRQLSLGNFSQRVSNQGNDEFGHMGQLVNRLAEKMEKDKYLGYLWGTEDEVDEILKGRD